jgi:hypothetical protein
MIRRPSRAGSNSSDADLPSYGRRRPSGPSGSSSPVDNDYDSDVESEGHDGDYFYGGYQSPTGSPRFSFKDKALPGRALRLRRFLLTFTRSPWAFFLSTTFIFFVTTTRYRTRQRHLLEELQINSVEEVIAAFTKMKEDNRRWEREIFAQKGAERETHARYTALERSNRLLQKERDELRGKVESPERRNEELKIKAREEAWKQQIQLLREATVRESRRAAIEKYVLACRNTPVLRTCYRMNDCHDCSVFFFPHTFFSLTP